MTFHRTAGKGGTRNSRTERHFTNPPNFNKKQGSGANPRGRVKHNPPAAKKDTRAARKDRYDEMMSGRYRRGTPGLGSFAIGRSKVTGRY